MTLYKFCSILNWFPRAQLVESIDSFVFSIECKTLSIDEINFLLLGFLVRGFLVGMIVNFFVFMKT